MWDLFALVLEMTRTFALKRGVGNGMMNGKDLDCRNRARRKSLRLADARVGRVKCAKMQHSPSSAANPQVLQVNCDLVFGARFCEDVHGHILRGAIDDVDCPVHDGLSNEVESYVDVLGASMIVVIHCEMDSGLIVAVECGG